MIKHLIGAAIVGVIVWLGLPILEQYIKIPDPTQRFNDLSEIINAKYLPVGGGAAVVWLLFLKSLIKGMMMMALLAVVLAAGAYLVFVGI
jgi:hypothetical protein